VDKDRNCSIALLLYRFTEYLSIDEGEET
jgi:hypothetical protein